MIFKCYAAKLQSELANARARGRGKSTEKSVRFDKFVIRFFKRSHGTMGIARRHLRAFVRSVEQLLETAADASLLPRVALFAELAGISKNVATHNARLVPAFLYPALKVLYPDAKYERMVGRGKDQKAGLAGAELVPLALMLKALLSTLPLAVRTDDDAANRMLHLFEQKIDRARHDKKMVDVDLALYLALPLFKQLDLLTAFRRKRAGDLCRNFVHKFLERHRKRVADQGTPADREPTPEESAT